MFSLNQPSGPIQSISLNVRAVAAKLCHFFLLFFTSYFSNFQRFKVTLINYKKRCQNLQFRHRNVEKLLQERKVIFGSLQIIVDGSRSRSAAASCCVNWGSYHWKGP